MLIIVLKIIYKNLKLLKKYLKKKIQNNKLIIKDQNHQTLFNFLFLIIYLK